VVAVTLFGKIVVARYATLEQAEWRARKLGEEAERNPRGYVQYLARPAERPAGNQQQDVRGGIMALDPDRAAKPALLS
jgi:hypothetical protein